MSARSRTNQLVYQAELMIGLSVGDDEHAAARQMALEEGALALFELALVSLLKEVTEHARLPDHDWRRLLASDGRSDPLPLAGAEADGAELWGVVIHAVHHLDPPCRRRGWTGRSDQQGS